MSHSAALAAMVMLSTLDSLPIRKEPQRLRVMIPPRNSEEAIRLAEEKRARKKAKRAASLSLHAEPKEQS